MNGASIRYLDADDNVETAAITSDPITLTEPSLVIEKSVSPAHAQPGDTVFFDVRLYHAATSTVLAYNVAVTDVVPGGLNYLPGSWDQIAGPAADTFDDNNSPLLTAGWSVVPTTTTQANPIELRFAAVISPAALLPATSPSGYYEFPDAGAEPGQRYVYWLYVLNNDGSEPLVATDEVNPEPRACPGVLSSSQPSRSSE